MSQHTPWSQEEAEKWAKEHALKVRSCSESSWRWADSEQDFLAGVAWAAQQIEKCPSLYRNTSQFRELWDIRRNPYDTHEAKLVGVRPIEKGKTDGE